MKILLKTASKCIDANFGIEERQREGGAWPLKCRAIGERLNQWINLQMNKFTIELEKRKHCRRFWGIKGNNKVYVRTIAEGCFRDSETPPNLFIEL